MLLTGNILLGQNTALLDSLKERFDQYAYDDPTLAKSIADSIIGLGETLDDPLFQGYGFHMNGILTMNRSDYVSSLTYFKKALDYYILADDTCSIQGAYFNIGSVLSSLGDDVRAINYYRLSEQIPCDDNEYYMLVYNMATTFYSLELDTLARKYLDILVNIDYVDDEQQMTKYVGYMMLSKYILADEKDTLQVIKLLEEAIEKSYELKGRESDLVKIYASCELAIIYQYLRKEDQVKKYLQLAESALDEIPFEDEELYLYYQSAQAQILQLRGDYEGSNEILYSILSLLMDEPSYQDYYEDVYQGLMKNYEFLNEQDSVLKYALKRIDLQKELLKKNIKYQSLLLELDENKRTLISVQEKALMKEKNSLRWIIFFLSLIILLIPVVFYFGYKRYHTEKLNKALKESNTLIHNKNQQLEDLNEDKKQIIRLLSHDLRTPLVNTHGILILYSAGLLEERELKQHTKLALQNLTELLEKVDNMIRWASGQMDGASVDLKKLNLYSLVQNLLPFINDQAANKGVDIDLTNLPTDAHVLADEEQLSLIIRNLLTNAIKFSHPDGKVVIRSDEESPGIVTLKIIDSGIGMDEKHLNAVLAEETVSSEGTEGEQGHGLGLRMVQHFARQNHIGFTLESQPGEGTVCKLTLAVE